MTLRTRLKRLEALAQRNATPINHRLLHRRTEEDWLVAFEGWGRQGFFDREPDFGVALSFYREALDQARGQTDPPFDPPVDFMPGMADDVRCLNWRTSFPKVREGWRWLAGMALRRLRATPPLTEAEFRELADWLEANADRLEILLVPSSLLDVGDGCRTSLYNLRLMMRSGPRAMNAGELANAVRRLRDGYGEILPTVRNLSQCTGAPLAP